MYECEGLPQKDDGWYVVPGKVDKSSYWQNVYFVGCVIFLLELQSLL